MWIRSQNRKSLKKCDDIAVVNIENTINIFAFDSREEITILGEYSTEEKAMKVLDMIEEHNDKCFAFEMEEGVYVDSNTKKTFQMPSDEEVEI